MTPFRPRPVTVLVPALVLAVSLSLAGCISVLPKEKPVQMYRFGAEPDAVAVPASAVPRTPLVLARVELPRAAAGDRLLAITGSEAAYVARARWVSPAAVLFEESVESAFEARSQAVRLLSRGETGASKGGLRVEASAFEARYTAPGAAPTVRVAARAALMRRNGSLVAEEAFSAEAPASENGVAAIVAAYGAAVSQLNGKLVAWADAHAAEALTPDPALPGPVVTRTTTSSTATTRR